MRSRQSECENEHDGGTLCEPRAGFRSRERAATIGLTTLVALGAAACSGGEVTGPADLPALASELEAALSVLESTAFGEVGRGVQYDEVLGGRGRDVIAAHAGAVFRWSREENRYVASEEAGPEDGVRFILYAALEAVPHGAPLVETGSISWSPAGDGLRAELITEHGARIELTATGEVQPVPQAQTLTITGQAVGATGAVYEFESTTRVTPDAEGTQETEFQWRGPGGLDVRFASFTTRITVFAGEDSEQELAVASRHGRAALVGQLLGGNGFFDLSIDGSPVGLIEQISELSPDLFGGIQPVGATVLTPELVAAARRIFRTKNLASTGLRRLVLPLF